MKGIKIENDEILLSINPKVYPIEVIYSASYAFLDKTYVILDGNPASEIIVRLKPKKKMELETLGREFYNELINYADYRIRAEETKNIREAMLQRVLITNDPGIMNEAGVTGEKDAEFEKLLKEIDDDDDFLDDPEGIAIPWEEKYGQDKKEGKEASHEKNEKKNKTE